VGIGNEHEPGATPGLGDLCYQIDLSAYPSQQGALGRHPTPTRMHFLESVMTAFAATARTLIFHGRAAAADCESSRNQLIAQFLGHVPAPSDWQNTSEPHAPLHHLTVGDRRVIVTRALGQASNELLARLARLVQLGPRSAPRRRVITVPPASSPARSGPRAATGTSPGVSPVTSMDRHRLLQLCLSQGLETVPQTQWTQVGPRGTTGQRGTDSRLFYINQSSDIVDLRRHSAPRDLMARAVDAGGDVQNGQIVARIPVNLFSELDWLRLIRHNQ